MVELEDRVSRDAVLKRAGDDGLDVLAERVADGVGVVRDARVAVILCVFVSTAAPRIRTRLLAGAAVIVTLLRSACRSAICDAVRTR